MKTTKSITESEIKGLRAAAVRDGEYVQAAVCDLALGGEPISADDYTAIGARDRRVHGLSEMTQDAAVQACVDAITHAAGA